MEPPSAIALRREPGPLVRSLVALSLRVGLGLVFVMFGLGKFTDRAAGKYPDALIKPFESTLLGRPPLADLVPLFAQVLPYVEVTLGAALIVGLLTTVAATGSAALLVNLLFGQLVLNNVATIPPMLTYLLVNAGILWLSPVTSNYLSVDGLVFGWFWAPRAEGRYQVEDAGRPIKS
jgi:uncharacterized membrane protein YphA (DoxX/SURF4 family)